MPPTLHPGNPHSPRLTLLKRSDLEKDHLLMVPIVLAIIFSPFALMALVALAWLWGHYCIRCFTIVGEGLNDLVKMMIGRARRTDSASTDHRYAYISSQTKAKCILTLEILFPDIEWVSAVLRLLGR